MRINLSILEAVDLDRKKAVWPLLVGEGLVPQLKKLKLILLRLILGSCTLVKKGWNMRLIVRKVQLLQ